MAPTAEVFENQPTGTVTSGGTTTGSTSFTVTATTAFPVASTSTNPNSIFRIVDAADTSEIMIVTTAPGGTGSGQSWTVTRGAEGTTAIDHSADWTCVQIISGGTMNQFYQQELMGQALYSCNDVSSASPTTIFSYTPSTQDQPVAGVVYEFTAFGTMGTSNTTTDSELVFKLTWNGTTLATLTLNSSGNTEFLTAMTSAGWWLEGSVVCLSSTSMVAGMNFMTHKTSTAYNAVTVTDDGTSAMAGVTVSGTGPLELQVEWDVSTAYTLNLLTGTGYAKRVS